MTAMRGCDAKDSNLWFKTVFTTYIRYVTMTFITSLLGNEHKSVDLAVHGMDFTIYEFKTELYKLQLEVTDLDSTLTIKDGGILSIDEEHFFDHLLSAMKHMYSIASKHEFSEVFVSNPIMYVLPVYLYPLLFHVTTFKHADNRRVKLKLINTYLGKITDIISTPPSMPIANEMIDNAIEFNNNSGYNFQSVTVDDDDFDDDDFDDDDDDIWDTDDDFDDDDDDDY